MRSTLAVPVFVILALAMPANAEECVPTTSTSDEDTTVVDLCRGESGTVCYVVIDHPSPAGDNCGEDTFLSVWIYPETNGKAGLQRNDGCVGDQSCGDPDILLGF